MSPANGGDRYRYTATVTIPRDARPGQYLLSARGTGYYAMAMLRVVPTLADTGDPVAPLAGLGALLVLSGGAAVAVGTRRRG